jgi:hypothetical protein
MFDKRLALGSRGFFCGDLKKNEGKNMNAHLGLFRFLPALSTAAFVFLTTALGVEEKADLRIQFPAEKVTRLRWSQNTASTRKGSLKDRPFVLETERRVAITMTLTGMRPEAGETSALEMRCGDMFSHNIQRIGDEAKSEVLIEGARLTAKENDKVTIDSENDVGLDKIPNWIEQVRQMENARARISLDAAGRTLKIDGDKTVLDQVKGGAAQNLFPLLAGKEVSVGESWEDAQEVSKLDKLALTRPVNIRSVLTFKRWVEKNERRMAEIHLQTVWGSDKLQGTTPEGLKINLDKVRGLGWGICFFDPQEGLFYDGKIDFTLDYELNAVKPDGETENLTVSERTVTMFEPAKEKAAATPKKTTAIKASGATADENVRTDDGAKR